MIKSEYGFTILASALDYENPYMQIYKHEVIQPDGAHNYYYTLSRFGSFSIIIPLFPDQTTVLVGQYRIPISTYSWEFPMGQVKKVSPLKMAKEELIQETGYRAQTWEKIGEYFLAPGHHEQKVYVYVAKDLKKGKSAPEEDEFLKVKRVTIDSVGKMIEHGKIKDGPTIIAYHYLEQYSNKK